MVEPIGTHLDELSEFQRYLLQAQNANAVLLAVAQLRLLDWLDDGPATADDIAKSAGLSAGHVFRVLRFLAVQAVVDRDGQGRFRHTSRSRLLQENLSGLRFLRETMGAAPGLSECLGSGRPAFECRFGMPVFRYLAEHADVADYFGDLMARTTAAVEEFIFSHHRFVPFDLAVDVGGSHGRLLIGLLARYRDARGVVFDLPETAAQAADCVAASPVADRIEARGGDFFVSVPAGADLYLLKQILHDWSDDECVQILSSVRAAIPDNGRLALIEYVLPAGDVNHPGFAMDIHMMVLSSGRERTLEEYERLLEAAAFRLDRVTDNPDGQSVVEGVPV